VKSLKESVVTALDGSDFELYPYLPYILQDLWEIGSDPEIIIHMIEKHFESYADLKLLDLGCGKGAVAIRTAKTLGCSCYGIDAVPEFVESAKEKAITLGVGHLCKFQTADIREEVKNLSGYDAIILGSIGSVFGDFHSTLNTLSKCIHENGIFIIDEGYMNDNSPFTHQAIQKKGEILQQIDMAGMQLIDEKIIPTEEIKHSNEDILGKIHTRCRELMHKHTDKKIPSHFFCTFRALTGLNLVAASAMKGPKNVLSTVCTKTPHHRNRTNPGKNFSPAMRRNSSS
jgi:ubiquinone/menaquinone biosynthesis C-methylase UbiE